MANELHLLPNPDHVPQGVESGYMRQNTNILAVQTGLDTTEPRNMSGGKIFIPAGGVIEVNGKLFVISNDTEITKPNTSLAYWIAVRDNGDGRASLEPVTRPGAWNPAKKGCYTNDNRRTLNWVSSGSLSQPPNYPEENYSYGVHGRREYTAELSTGWKYASLRSGWGGSDADGRAGGVINPVTGIHKLKIFFCDKPLKIHIGASGTSGGSGGAGGANGGSGGGGGSGIGEASWIEGVETTGNTKSGAGARGTVNGGTGGSSGQSGSNGSNGRNNLSTDSPGYGGQGGISVLTESQRNGTSGGSGMGSSTGGGGGGGAGGVNGSDMPDYSPGGMCNIWALTN